MTTRGPPVQSGAEVAPRLRGGPRGSRTSAGSDASPRRGGPFRERERPSRSEILLKMGTLMFPA